MRLQYKSPHSGRIAVDRGTRHTDVVEELLPEGESRCGFSPFRRQGRGLRGSQMARGPRISWRGCKIERAHQWTRHRGEDTDPCGVELAEPLGGLKIASAWRRTWPRGSRIASGMQTGLDASRAKRNRIPSLCSTTRFWAAWRRSSPLVAAGACCNPLQTVTRAGWGRSGCRVFHPVAVCCGTPKELARWPFAF